MDGLFHKEFSVRNIFCKHFASFPSKLSNDENSLNKRQLIDILMKILSEDYYDPTPKLENKSINSHQFFELIIELIR